MDIQYKLVISAVIIAVTIVILCLVGWKWENSSSMRRQRNEYNAMADRVLTKRSNPILRDLISHREKKAKKPAILSQRTCVFCGNFLDGAEKICPHCGSEIGGEKG